MTELHLKKVRIHGTHYRVRVHEEFGSELQEVLFDHLISSFFTTEIDGLFPEDLDNFKSLAELHNIEVIMHE